LSFGQTSLKVKGQGHEGVGQKTAFLTLSAACMRFMFGKTSLAFIIVNLVLLFLQERRRWMNTCRQRLSP